MRWSRITRGWITLILALAVLALMASPVQAFSQMSDEELSLVTGGGFSSFTLENDIAKAYFNIEARTFTEIDSLKMGNYNGGWDQDWTNVSLGSTTEDLVCKGLYIEAKFTDLINPATRRLDYIKVGTPSMTGPISADFKSFSGHIENPTAGVLVDGYRITTLGQRTITSSNSEFFMQLALNPASGQNQGWYFYWNNATISPVP